MVKKVLKKLGLDFGLEDDDEIIRCKIKNLKSKLIYSP
jgi:hypothetical protein